MKRLSAIRWLIILVCVWSYSALAAEKKHIAGNTKFLYAVSQTTSPVGDQPGHELVQAAIVSSNSANHPDWRNMVLRNFNQLDQTEGAGTHRGHAENLHENGDRNFFSIQGTHKMDTKANGAWEQSWEGKYTLTNGTGKFKDMTGGGTYSCKFSAEGGACEWQGDHYY
jgi:hypothetical protein